MAVITQCSYSILEHSHDLSGKNPYIRLKSITSTLGRFSFPAVCNEWTSVLFGNPQNQKPRMLVRSMSWSDFNQLIIDKELQKENPKDMFQVICK